jgi:nucleotide-binding universal stress UspA family protein
MLDVSRCDLVFCCAQRASAKINQTTIRSLLSVMRPGTGRISFRKILIPLDVSQYSVAALPFAVEMARCFQAMLVAIHVFPQNSHDTDSVRAAILRQVAEEASGVPHELVFDRGAIEQRLASFIGSWGPDLVILGAHATAGVDKLIHGSLAQELICSTDLPVLSIGEQVTRPAHYTRILYATDFSPTSEAAFVYSVSIAERFAASLLFLHVNEWSSDEPPVKAHEKTFEFFRDHVDRAGVKAIDLRRDVLVKFGARGDQILEVAADRKVDLIVIGVQCRHGVSARVSAHLPGPVYYEIMTQSPCAVLTVPANCDGPQPLVAPPHIDRYCCSLNSPKAAVRPA